MVKRLLKDHYPQHLERLDVEFSSGTAWLGDSRVCSAAGIQPEGWMREYYVVQTKPEKLWVHVAALARELRASEAKVRSQLEDMNR